MPIEMFLGVEEFGRACGRVKVAQGDHLAKASAPRKSAHRRENVFDDAQDSECSSKPTRLWRTSRGLRGERENHVAE